MQNDTSNNGAGSRIEIRDLTARSDAAGLLRLGGHVAILVATGTLIALSRDSWLILPAMLAHGIALVALFAPLHETVHRTPFRSRWLNDAVAAVIGLILMLPARFYRRFHFAHHRHTQDPLLDPEMAAPKPTTRIRYWLYLSGFYYWRDRSRELIRLAAGGKAATFVPDNERSLVTWEARWHLAIYLALFALVVIAQRPEPLLFWFLPAVLGQPFLRAYLLTEHTGCPEVSDMFTNTRTTHTNALVRYLMWNMPYHAEHHAFPAVPFSALPALHERMAARLQVVAPSYRAFHGEYRTALREGRGQAFVDGSLRS